MCLCINGHTERSLISSLKSAAMYPFSVIGNTKDSAWRKKFNLKTRIVYPNTYLSRRKINDLAPLLITRHKELL